MTPIPHQLLHLHERLEELGPKFPQAFLVRRDLSPPGGHSDEDLRQFGSLPVVLKPREEGENTGLQDNVRSALTISKDAFISLPISYSVLAASARAIMPDARPMTSAMFVLSC